MLPEFLSVLRNSLIRSVYACNPQMTATDEPPRRRGRPPSGGREAILDGDARILREHGIANLTSREVAARAGVSDASVYYHFGDRAGLLQAVFEHGMKPLRSCLGTLEEDERDPLEVLDWRGRTRSSASSTKSLPVLHRRPGRPGAARGAGGYIEPSSSARTRA